MSVNNNGSHVPGPAVSDPRDAVDLGYADEPPPPGTKMDNGNEDEAAKAGLFGTSSNLINTIVGAGIIGIPYAFRQSGWIVGLFLLCLVGYLTDKSLRIMIDMAKFHPKLKSQGISSFERLASYPFGNLGKNVVLLSMMIMAYGAMVAYLLIIKDTVPTLMGIPHDAYERAEREIILIITSLLIMLPLSMQRDMANLSYTSCLSVTADIMLVIFIVVFAPIQESVAGEGGLGQVLRTDAIEPTLFIGLGVLSTAMACQHSAFIVSGSLVNLTRSRWAFVTASSIGTATVLCAIMGSAGYLGFLDETKGDVLNNFDADSMVANVARGLLAVTMFFTYPMEAFVARHVVACVFYGNAEVLESADGGRCCNLRQKVTFAIYLSTMLPALIFNDLGPVLSITGALGGSVISYMIPGAVFLGVNGSHFCQRCRDMIGQSNGGGNVDGNIELPAAGASSQRTNGQGGTGDSNMDLPVEGQQMQMTVQDQSKPIWWYLLGYPLWYGIASAGARGLEDAVTNPSDFDLHNSDDEEEDLDSLANPTSSDYRIAMSFITFGIVAAVAGFSSNLYVIATNENVAG